LQQGGPGLTDQQNFIEIFRQQALNALEEIFVEIHHMMLDPQEPMFKTLDEITAEIASKPIGAEATLAAHLDHVGFYIDVLLAAEQNANWALSWSITSTNEEGLVALKDRLRASYESLRATIQTIEDWDEDAIGMVISQIGHAAYHLGVIREALAILRASA
jgi:hypothetical protein